MIKRRRARVALRPVGESLEERQLLANVGLDWTFGLGGVANTPNPAGTATMYSSTSVSHTALQTDGRIIAVGARSSYDSTPPGTSANNIFVERLNPDGTLDGSYGTGGTVVLPNLPFGGGTIAAYEAGAALQADGKLLILAQTNGTPTGGSFSITDFAVIRLLQNGALDTSFGTGGVSYVDFGAAQTVSDQTDIPRSIAISPSGQIVVAGYTYTSTPGGRDMAVARLGANGALDTSFGTGGKQIVAFNRGGDNADEANAVAIDSLGGVVLVGSATVGTVVIDSTTHMNTDVAVARLTAQGVLDTSFGTGGLATVAYDLGYDRADVGNAVVVLANQIVIAGTSSVSHGGGYSSMVNSATFTRMSNTAAVSSRFNQSLSQQGATFSTSGDTLNVLADGSLLLGGNANATNGTAYGQYFTNFNVGGGMNTAYGTGGTAIINGTSSGGNVVVQPDGKLVFATYNGVARTAAPAPEVVSADLVFPNTRRNARSRIVVLQFNTQLNPDLAGNKSLYRVRIGRRGRNFVQVRRVIYDAATQTVTLRLARQFNRKAKLFVLISPMAIAGADNQFLNGGLPTTIPVTVA